MHGDGFEPGSIITIVAHSTPAVLGTATVGQNGSFATSVGLPSDLRVGAHHVIVIGTLKDGSAVALEKAFSIAGGGLLGSVGSTPPGPLAVDVAFVPTSHPASVLATTAGTTAAVGAVSLALGGGTGGGARGVRGGGYLEDVELEREERELAGRSRGDRSRTWRWRWTRHVDQLSRHLPSRVARISPVAGRVLVDGDYLRAMFGGAWLALCGAAVGLGIYAASSTGWYALPPSLGIFLSILALGVLDSTLGYLAGIAFIASAALAGHLFGATEMRVAAGLVLLWFAVPLAASALRPLRRNVHLNIASIWERAADLVIGGLFAAWAAEKMTGALSGLAGVELPINKSVNVVALCVLGFVAVRIVIESIAAHDYPIRLEAVHHQGGLESSNLQVGVSLVIQILLFIFISIAFLGSSWALYVGAAVFFSPLVPWLFADKIPKSALVTKWKPSGLALWTLIIVAGVLLSKFLSLLIHNDKLLENVGFILLPLPVLVAWALELFEVEEDEDSEELEFSDGAYGWRFDERDAAVDAPVEDASSNGADSRLVAQLDPHSSSTAVSTLEMRTDERHESLRGQFRDAEAIRLEEKRVEESEAYSSLRAWSARFGGAALVALCVYLVVAHIAGG